MKHLFENKILWSKNDIEFLKNNFSNLSDSDISNKLNRSLKSIQSMARRLNLKKDLEHISRVNKFRVESRWSDRIWNKEDINLLISEINKLSNEDLSKKLGRTKDSILSMINKLGIKRDKKYNKDFIESECLKYITKQEMRLSDPNLYHWLYRNGKMPDVSSHMLRISFSSPQLILKYIIETMSTSQVRYNDRFAIKPYELDVYIEDKKLAFEYDGSYYHSKTTDFKTKLCELKNIKLIVINESNLKNKSFNSYVESIKSQIISNLNTINERLGINISKQYVTNIQVNPSDIFKGLFKVEDLRKICNKYDNYTEFIKNEKGTYQKIRYMGLLEELTNHMSTDSNNLDNILEMKNFYKIGDVIIVEYWYNSMLTKVKIVDIIGRKFKVSHKIEGSKIKNAPDELVLSTDIIDHYRTDSI